MSRLQKIVIVGGGTAGWVTAAMLGHHLQGRMAQIELVESDDIGTIGVGESTIPPFITLLRNLGIDEQHFIQATQASFKLGISFRDWLRKGESYFHPFGSIGGAIDIHEFFQCWLKAKLTENHPSNLQDFAPASVMAEKGRFMLPFKAQRTLIGGANYALHVDARLVAQYLRRFAEAKGVKRTEGIVTEVKTRPSDGFVEKLVLKTGEEVTGDLFIDCSGFRALLIEKTLGVGYHDWSDVLLCDRAVAVQTENRGATTPFTVAEAQDSGWRWRIPLQHRTGNGYVFSSKFISDEEATEVLLSKVDGELLTKPMVIPFKTGVRHRIWDKNVVSVGLASGFIEPLESTAIHLVYRAIDMLFRYMPDQDCAPALAAEYNRRMTADYEEIRDFIVLHYCVTEREDTPFWRAAKAITPPASLTERIELYRESGLMREGLDELFRNPSWQSVLDGMGVTPKRYDQLVDRMPFEVIRRTLDEAGPRLAAFVDTLPTHDEFLREHCPAEPPGVIAAQ
ncbi:tryptophan halogenase family protein [Phenylobacterium deserti]|uniref:Tryptophan halogenase n=1 Tax=Phenylobacterium deserti TaxID=1914756 RepID=A0A328ABW4_9CAUL|nr:tryptophan halogenase family protein [Phenylobacterium deserti]RAK50834.1 tryptophan halogenase [Phenylobacterium deserti]